MLFKASTKGKPPRLFSLGCNLLKMDVYSNDFQKIFLAKNLCDCQIRSNQILSCQCKCYEPFPFLIDQISKITTKDISQSVATTFQRRQSQLDFRKNVSATCLVGQSHLGTSWYITRTSQIGRFCLRTSETSQRRFNRSVLLTYQLRRRDDVSTWSRTVKLVPKMGQFLLGTRHQIFSASQVVQSL